MTLRGFAFRIVNNPWFDRFIIAAILVNCVFLARSDPNSDEETLTDSISSGVFTFVFFMEMVIRMFALGVSGYFEEKWNWIDFIVVVESISSSIISLIDLIPGVNVSGGSSSSLQGLRTIRVLRPLKTISFIPEMKLLFATFFNSLSLAIQTTVLLFIGILIFSNAGQIYFSPHGDFRCQGIVTDYRCPEDKLRSPVTVNMTTDVSNFTVGPCTLDPPDLAWPHYSEATFTYQSCGGLYQCGTDPCQQYYEYVDDEGVHLRSSDLRPYSCNTTQSCVNVGQDLEPDQRFANYRTLWWSMITTFQVITMEGWQEVMFSVQDTSSGYVWPYYLFILVTCTILLVNLYPAILSVKLQGAIEADKQQKSQEKLAAEDRAAGLSQRKRSEFETIKVEFIKAETEDQKIKKKIRNKMAIKAEEDVDEKLPRLTPNFFCCGPLRAFIKPEWGPFAKFIYFSIFANIVILSANQAHPSHIQSQILYYFNTIFSGIFAVEAGIKLLVFGPVGYFMDPFNVFDFVVSLLGVVELFVDTLKGITALRIVRISRLGKLLRVISVIRLEKVAMKSSQGSEAMDFPRILQVMFIAGPWVFYIYVLLLLFLFIFSILGMQFFGTYHQPSFTEFHMLDAIIPLNVTNEDTIYGFHTFGRSFISVFQVATADRWEELFRYVDELADSDVQGFYFIFFAAMIVITRWIILSLIIAVLFDSVHKDGIEIIRIRAKGVMSSVYIMDFARERYVLKHFFLRWKEKTMQDMMALGKQPQGRIGIDDVQEEPEETWWVKFKKSEKAWLLLDKNSKMREMFQKIERTKAFEMAILFAIIGSSTAVALEAQEAVVYADDDDYTRNSAYVYLDIVSTIIFFIEILVRSFAFGFYFMNNAYLKQSKTHYIDVFVTIASAVSLFSTGANLNVVRAIRLIRCIRPLQLVARSPAMHNIFEALKFGFTPILIVLFFLLFFLYIFAIIGMQQWAGDFYYCAQPLEVDAVYMDLPAPGVALNATNCGDIENGYYNFDNVLNGIITMFIVFTLDGWDEVLRSASATVGFGQEPSWIYHNPYVILFFLIFIFIGIIITTLFIGTIYGTFMYLSHTNEKDVITGQKKQKNSSMRQAYWVLYMQKLQQVRPKVEPVAPKNPIRKKLFNVCISPRYKAAVACFMAINLTIRYGIGGTYTIVNGFKDAIPNYIWFLERISNVIYMSEWGFRFLAFGPCVMLNFRSPFVFADFIICFILFVTLTHYPQVSYSDNMKEFYKFFEALAGLRALRFIALFPSMTELVQTLGKAIWNIVNLLFLLFLIVFFYAVVGLIFFGEKEFLFANVYYHECTRAYDMEQCNDLYSRHLNFGTLASSFNILYGLITGEHWTTLMTGLVDEMTSVAGKILVFVYFISFVVLGRFLVFNLFMMTILYYYNIHSPDQVGIAKHEVEQFRETWYKMQKSAGQTDISVDELKAFLRKLGEPLGVSRITSGKDTEWYVNKVREIIKERTYDFIIPDAEGTPAKQPKKKGILSCWKRGAQTTDVDDKGYPLRVTFTELIVALHYLSFFGAPGWEDYISEESRQETRKQIGVMKLAVQRWAMRQASLLEVRGTNDKYLVMDVSLIRRSMLDLFYTRFADVMFSQIMIWRADIKEHGYVKHLEQEADLIIEALEQESTSLLKQLTVVKEILNEHKIGDSKYLQRETRLKENLRLLRLFLDMMQSEQKEYVEEFWVPDSMENCGGARLYHEKAKTCNSICMSADGHFLFASFGDKSLRIYKAKRKWIMAKEQMKKAKEDPGGIPEGDVFTPYQTLKNKKTKKKTETVIFSRFLSMVCTADGKKVFCGGEDSTIYVYMQEAKVGKEAKKKKKLDYIFSNKMTGHKGAVYNLCLHEVFLLSAGADGVVHMWRTRGREPVQSITISGGTLGFGRQALFALALSKNTIVDNKDTEKVVYTVFAGGENGMISGMPIRTDPNFLNTEVWSTQHQCLAFSPDNKTKSSEFVTALSIAWGYLYAGGSAGSIQVFQLQFDTEERVPPLINLLSLNMFHVHTHVVCCLEFQSGVLFSGSRDLSLVAWRKPSYVKEKGAEKGFFTQEMVDGYIGHTEEIMDVCSSEHVLVSADAKGGILVRAPERVHRVCNEKRLHRETKDFLKRRDERDEKIDSVVDQVTTKHRKGLTLKDIRADDENRTRKKMPKNLNEIKRPKVLDNCTADIYVARVMKGYYGIQSLQERGGQTEIKQVETEEENLEEKRSGPLRRGNFAALSSKFSKSIKAFKSPLLKKSNKSLFDVEDANEEPSNEEESSKKKKKPKFGFLFSRPNKMKKKQTPYDNLVADNEIENNENMLEETKHEGFDDLPDDTPSLGHHPSEGYVNQPELIVLIDGTRYSVPYRTDADLNWVVKKALGMYQENNSISGVECKELQMEHTKESLDLSDQISTLDIGQILRLIIDDSNKVPKVIDDSVRSAERIGEQVSSNAKESDSSDEDLDDSENDSTSSEGGDSESESGYSETKTSSEATSDTSEGDSESSGSSGDSVGGSSEDSVEDGSSGDSESTSSNEDSDDSLSSSAGSGSTGSKNS